MERHGLLPTQLGSYVSVEHVGAPLVHPSQGQVQVQDVDVCHLHGRVDELRCVQLCLLLLPPHDTQRPLDAGHCGCLGRPKDGPPVFTVGHQLARILKADLLRDPERTVGLHEVLSASPDLLPVTPELVIDVGVPVCQQDGDMEARLGEVCYLSGHDGPCPKVDQAAGLQTNIGLQPLLLNKGGPQLLPGYNLY